MDLETSSNGSAPPVSLTAGVTRATLPNGLTLLIKENHHAPLVALLISFQIGYFHEPDRLNGITHVIEHMMFKGTTRRPQQEQFAREVRALGGSLNASTYYEETAYYIVVPSQHLEQAIELQADVLQNALFDTDALTQEIEVIVQESQQKRDNPGAMLVESLYALAYDQHRLRRWRIGHAETLRALTRADLVAFVQQTYRPENLKFAIIGDVEAEQAHRLVQRYWGDLPRGDFQRERSPIEPERLGFRYQRLTGDTRQRLLILGVPAPPVLHPDAVPLMALSALLSDGRSARLYRRLREELQLANSAWASYEGFGEMGVFTLGAESRHDDPLPLERALWAAVDPIRHELVDVRELERIKTRVESRRLYAQEEILGIARTLASCESLGDYRLADTMLEQLRAVTPEEVRRVARTYLDLSRAALLEYLPESAISGPPPAVEEVESALQAVERQADAHDTQDRSSQPAVARHQEPPLPTILLPHRAEETTPRVIALPGGGKLLYRARHDLPIVALSALYGGGRRHEIRANAGITNLMLKSVLKGTRAFSAEEIANRIEGLGSGIGTSVGADSFGYGIKITRNALREGFSLFTEVVAHPTFPAAEVAREQEAIYAEIRRQQDNNFAAAYDLLTAACFGDDHPYGLPSSGLEAAVATLTPLDLAAWRARHVTAANLVVGLVGAIEEEEAVALLTTLLEESQKSQAAEEGEVPLPATASPLPALPSERVTYRQKQQTAAALGFPGAAIGNEDRYALDVLAEITAGMGGRFFRTVRGENALAYQVSSFHRSRLDAGNFVIYTATAPENETRARDLLLTECETLGREPVRPEELESAKATLQGNYLISTQTFGAQAGELAQIGVLGLPPDEPQRYLARIQSVTGEAVRDVARRYLTPARYWLGVVRGVPS